jgi:hypothetical protein
MPLNAGSEERTGGGGAALGEGQEEFLDGAGGLAGLMVGSAGEFD